MLTTNLHNIIRAEAGEADGAAWVCFHANSGHVSVFMPSLAAAKSVADAMNEALLEGAK